MKTGQVGCPVGIDMGSEKKKKGSKMVPRFVGSGTGKMKLASSEVGKPGQSRCSPQHSEKYYLI